jgi:diguanylate cyclase (GGDEF)-like protein
LTAKSQYTDMLDVLCPMHLVLRSTGHIEHVGPTLRKLRDVDLLGRRFLEEFELKRPRGIMTMQDLSQSAGMKLHLQLRAGPKTDLKGVLMPSGDPHKWVLNLSFGISILDAVQDHDLNSADFAPTDLTVEMLYLVEAKSAAMEASRKLNQRLQGAKIAAEEQAYTDTLTGLKNRRAVDLVFSRLEQWETPVAIMQVDLDWFKAVNDTHGHAAGDHVLQRVAQVLVEETRSEDTVARLGGDEFVIILPHTHDEKVLRRIGRRVVERLEEPIPFQGITCQISASIGTALYEPGHDETPDDVMHKADLALYASKRGGRAQMSFYNGEQDIPPDDSKAVSRQAAH